MDLGEIITSVLVVIVGAVVVWLQQRNLEKFKVDLGQSAFEHQTRYAKLHETRTEVIAELYKRLARTQAAFESLMAIHVPTGAPRYDERIQAAAKNYNELQSYWIENRLYFSDEVGAKLDGLYNEYAKTFYAVILPRPDGPDSKDWIELFEKITKVLKGVQKDVENDFRQMLGDTSMSKGSV